MKIRVASAFIAAILLVAMFLIWQTKGLYIICSAVTLFCIYEYVRLALVPIEAPFHLQGVFCSLTAGLYFATVWSERYGLYLGAISAVLFLTMVLMTIRGVDDLAYAFKLQSAGLVGLLYCGIFPGLAVRSMSFEEGPVWLFGLMGIVFSGDTFAYLVGRAFGRTKLLEAVSPKKTFEGALGGLIGSSVAGLVLGYFFLPRIPLPAMVILALTTGFFAQVGDLYESLLKRLADVKDSGSIMPGHGGMLDRLDGVIFAAPVYYVLARLLV